MHGFWSDRCKTQRRAKENLEWGHRKRLSDAINIQGICHGPGKKWRKLLKDVLYNHKVRCVWVNVSSGTGFFAQISLLPKVLCFTLLIGYTPRKCPFPWRHLHPHVILVRCTLNPPHSASIPNCISTSSAVFLHNSWQRVPILYNVR